MTEAPKAAHRDHTSPHPAGNKTLMGVSLLWLIGAGALVYSTVPEAHSSARFVTHTIAAENAEPAAVKAIPANAVTATAAGAAPSIAASPKFDFIVKFNPDHPDMTACANMFRTDKNKAREIFKNWATTNQVFDDMQLKTVNYSGEMLITWTPDKTGPLSKRDVEEKLQLIKSATMVRYADKDSQITVQKGH